jgi:hypothetical protein
VILHLQTKKFTKTGQNHEGSLLNIDVSQGNNCVTLGEDGYLNICKLTYQNKEITIEEDLSEKKIE